MNTQISEREKKKENTVLHADVSFLVGVKEFLFAGIISVAHSKLLNWFPAFVLDMLRCDGVKYTNKVPNTQNSGLRPR